jgi:hypothetical protein
MRLLVTPALIIFSFVEFMYFPSFSVSPIFIQLTPSCDDVMNSLIGRGEPPRAISDTKRNLTHSQFCGISKGISSSIHLTVPSANFS